MSDPVLSIFSEFSKKSPTKPKGGVADLSPATQALLGRIPTNSYELMVQRRLNREKVVEFEKEIGDKLYYLQQIEAKMNEINEKRIEWLKNISFQQVSGNSNFTSKVQLIKYQSVLISNQLKMDCLRLDSQLETLQLSTLVEGTRALDYKETLEQRELAMFLKSKTDLETIKVTMQASLDYRIQLANYLYQLLSNLKELQAITKKDAELNLENIQKHLRLFREQMQSFEVGSKNNYQSIIKDYLILRHNANVVQQIIVRNQNNYTQHRAMISKELEKLLHTAKEKQAKIEVTNSQEIISLTNNLREEIVNKERIVEELVKNITILKRQKFQNYQSIIKEITKYDTKTIKIEKNRKAEIDSIHFELNYLRKGIKGLEDHLYFNKPLPEGLLATLNNNPPPKRTESQEIEEYDEEEGEEEGIDTNEVISNDGTLSEYEEAMGNENERTNALVSPLTNPSPTKNRTRSDLNLQTFFD
jgi:hypothetical protein